MIQELAQDIQDNNKYNVGSLWDSARKYFKDTEYDEAQVEMYFFGLNVALSKIGKTYKWSWLKRLAEAFFLHNSWDESWSLDPHYLDWYASAPELK
jgi:hypothetical protein